MENLLNRYIDYRNKFENSLILNPTENIPWKTKLDIDFFEGLYIFEEEGNENSTVLFGGRKPLLSEYNYWNTLLSAEVSSFKPNSGLDAHILLFMSVASVGDRILYLSDIGGGHSATLNILKRLGLQTKDFPIDFKNSVIDKKETAKIIETWIPNFIFVDRSNGLNYENFTWLCDYTKCIKIFDASQYLSHIIAGDYLNPFDMGFDIIISTLHKNYPGPQKATIFSKRKDMLWSKIEDGLRSYVSNCHPKDIFQALLAIPSHEEIKRYSALMLENARVLEYELKNMGIMTTERNSKELPTQQIWIQYNSKQEAYHAFKRLEKIGIHVNYKLLPFNKGYGLRLGTAGATRQGLHPRNCKQLSVLIASAIQSINVEPRLIKNASKFINEVKTSEQ